MFLTSIAGSALGVAAGGNVYQTSGKWKRIMMKTGYALMIGSLAILGAVPAGAKIFKLTVDGKVIAPYAYANDVPIDYLGLFGRVGGDLNQLPFRLVYTIDTAQPWVVAAPVTISNNPLIIVSQFNSGTATGSSQAITAAITINGRKVDGIGSQSLTDPSGSTGFGGQSRIVGTDWAGGDGIDILARSSANTIDAARTINGVSHFGLVLGVSTAFDNRLALPQQLYTTGADFLPFTLHFGPTDRDSYYNGYFSYSQPQLTRSVMNAYFGIETITMSAVGGVPEPASWAMLIAGFGLTGAAMRRRRAALATA